MFSENYKLRRKPLYLPKSYYYRPWQIGDLVNQDKAAEASLVVSQSPYQQQFCLIEGLVSHANLIMSLSVVPHGFQDEVQLLATSLCLSCPCLLLSYHGSSVSCLSATHEPFL